MKRNIQIGVGGAVILVILLSVLYQGVQSTVFFHTPAEILADPDAFRSRTIRIGALVEPGTTQWDAQAVQLRFKVTEDSQHFIPVVFDGVKPDMYREGQGVVVEGSLDAGGVFRATQVLVKHSEEYNIDEGQVAEKEAAYRRMMEQRAAQGERR